MKVSLVKRYVLEISDKKNIDGEFYMKTANKNS